MPPTPKKKFPSNPTGRKGDPISLAPLTVDEALSAVLRVKPADVKKLEDAERAAKQRGKKKG